jgi:hypothetical protein
MPPKLYVLRTQAGQNCIYERAKTSVRIGRCVTAVITISRVMIRSGFLSRVTQPKTGVFEEATATCKIYLLMPL